MFCSWIHRLRERWTTRTLRARSLQAYREPIRYPQRFRVEELESRLTPAAPVAAAFDPDPNAIDAAANTNIVADFDQNINAATVTPTTFVVQGMQSGKLTTVGVDISSISVSGSTITLDPAGNFFAGETVQITATAGIQNSGGEGADKYVWQFQVGATGGTGNFTNSSQSLGSGTTSAIVLGDLNNDGFLDAAGQGKVWLNNGSGTLVDSGASLTASPQIALGDIDSDGDLDIVGSTVYKNDGSGNFTSFQTGLLSNAAVGLGDIDGDGDLDAVIASTGSVPGRIYKNDGTGTFTDTGGRFGSHFAYNVSLGDVDGDGDLDFLEAGFSGSNSQIYLNDGSGNFTDGYNFYIFGSYDNDGYAGTLGDLDGDGDLDVVLGSSSNGIGIFLNNGSGNYSRLTQTTGVFSVTGHLSVALGDVDTDGDLDLVVGNQTSGTASQLFLNNGSGLFSNSGVSLGDTSVYSVALGDLNSDGSLDIVLANSNAAGLVYANQDGDLAITIAQTPADTSISVGDTVTYTITASNGSTKGQVDGATVAVDFDDLLTGVTWTAVFAGGATGTASGSGDVSQSVDLPAGASIVYTVTGTVSSTKVDQAAIRMLTTTGSITLPTGSLDPVTTNNTDTKADLILGVTSGTGIFSNSGLSLGSGSTSAIVLGDLNNDGYLDAAGQGKVWLNNGSGTLVDTGASLSASPQIALGDIDGDSDLDIVGSTVYKNDGAGNFTSFQTGLLSNAAVALGDIDGDGDLDAVIASTGSVPGRIYKNDGTGAFTDTGGRFGSHFAYNVSLGDVDGDGDLDFLEAGFSGSNSQLYLNDGSGNFTDGYNFYIYSSYDNDGYAGTLGDLDGDGDLDVVLGSSNDGIGIFLNDGSGNYSRLTQTSGVFSVTGQLSVALGDVDDDGDLDLVVGNQTSGTASQLFLNNGSASFSNSGQSLGDTSVYSVALGDLNSDGDLDILLANSNAAGLVYSNADTDLSITIAGVDTSFVQGGTAAYTITVSNSDSGRSVTGAVVTTDLDSLLSNVTWQAVFADGASGTTSGTGNISQSIDLPSGASVVYTVIGTVTTAMTNQAAIRTLSSVASVAAPSSIIDEDSSNNSAINSEVLVLGSSSGTATFVDDSQSLGSGSTSAIVLGDLNNDGYLDAVGQGKVWLNDGAGTLVDTGASLSASPQIALGDIDSDGDLDIVGSTVYKNDGSGTFTSFQTGLLSNAAVALGDLDADGDLDAIIASTGSVPGRIYTNDGTGTFTDNGGRFGSHFAYNVSVGDVDGDGDLDFLEAGFSGSNTQIYLNDGSGNFTDGYNFYIFGSYDNDGYAGTLGDLDGDGDLDVVIGSSNDGIGIFLNDGSGSYSRLTQTTGVFTATGHLSVALGDFDGDGDLDLVVGNQTASTASQLFLNNGSASFSNSGQSLGDTSVYSVAVGDLNNDGDLDILLANSNAAGAVYDNQDPAATTDLQITITDGLTTEVVGTSVTYTITATNSGSTAVTGASIASVLSSQISGITWTASFGSGASGTASGSGDIDQLVNLAAGATVTYTVSGTVSSAATGSLISSASIHTPAGVGDTNFANNQATDADSLNQAADLQVTVTDGQTSAVPGNTITYTIVVTNAGPASVVGATVTDTFAASLSNISWTAVFSSGASGTASGTGDISQSVNLTSGATVTYTVTATVRSSATGSLANTVSVAAPSGVTDTSAGNNSATDTDTLTPQVDLQITVTDGQTAAIPGNTITYTIVVTNAGPSDVTGATVIDTFAASLSNVQWTAMLGSGASGTTSGSGNISQSVNLTSGASITYTVTATVLSSATGSLANSATVTAPGTVTETASGNNSATDTDTLTPQVDLQVAVTDGQTAAIPGNSITYTIVVTNAGPSDVTGATVADTFAASLSNVQWTAVLSSGASGTTSGSGNISQSVNLTSGASITYTVTATVLSSATGSLANTATVSTPGTVTETASGNNTATDTDTLTPQVDLQITVTDGQTTAISGNAITYTIVVTNAGPSDVTGATVADTFSASLSNVQWTAVLGSGASGTTSGSGNISETVSLSSGATITYTVTATVLSSATGSLTNTATVTAPGTATETASGNNTATDTDTLTPQVDLQITVTDGQTSAIPGNSITYTIVVTNAGPSDATGAAVTDNFSASLSNVSWTAVLGSGASGTSSGSGNISETVNLSSGASITYTVTATVLASATGSLVNTATISAPGTVTETASGNNTATDTDSLTPQVDLQIAVTDGQTSAIPGNAIAYTIVVTNAGPSDVTGATVTDTFAASLSNVQWTAVLGSGSSGTTSGSGNISQSVNLSSGASITYTVTATVLSSATGTLANTATVSAPGTVTETASGNNSATDTNTLTPQVDLRITLTDGVTTAAPGDSLTYVIFITNDGPSNVVGATLVDFFPAGLTGITWTAVFASGASGNASGTGNISESVNLASGASIAYAVSASVLSSASGSLINTATIAAPAGTTDPDSNDNSAADIDSLDVEADLGIAIVTSSATATQGAAFVYTIIVTNNGPADATDVVVTGSSGGFAQTSWTARFIGGATGSAFGVGALSESVDLPSGAAIVYTVSGLAPQLGGSVIGLQAAIASIAGIPDADLLNNQTGAVIPVLSATGIPVDVLFNYVFYYNAINQPKVEPGGLSLTDFELTEDDLASIAANIATNSPVPITADNSADSGSRSHRMHTSSGTRGAISSTGTLFNDMDGDGTLGAGESILANQKIVLEVESNGAFVPVKTGKTDENGRYSFDRLPPGQYRVRPQEGAAPAIKQSFRIEPRLEVGPKD